LSRRATPVFADFWQVPVDTIECELLRVVFPEWPDLESFPNLLYDMLLRLTARGLICDALGQIAQQLSSCFAPFDHHEQRQRDCDGGQKRRPSRVGITAAARLIEVTKWRKNHWPSPEQPHPATHDQRPPPRDNNSTFDVVELFRRAAVTKATRDAHGQYSAVPPFAHHAAGKRRTVTAGQSATFRVTAAGAAH